MPITDTARQMHFSMPLNTPPAFAPPYTSKILRYQFDGEIKTWQIIHQIPAIPTDSKAKRNSILGDKDSFPVSWRFKKNGGNLVDNLPGFNFPVKLVP